MASHTYDFNITMTCGGCSGAVERVLKKMDGMLCHLMLSYCRRMTLSPIILPRTSRESFIPRSSPTWLVPSKKLINMYLGLQSYDVSLEKQSAHIVTDPANPNAPDYAAVLEKIKKTGKTVNSGSSDGATQTV